MSKLESGEVVLFHEPMDLGELSRDILVIIEQRAAESGIILEYDKDSERVVYNSVYGSPLHVRQIFLNIYSNCIKYNKIGGKVETACTCLGVKDGTVTYRWTIRDTGIGMNQEFLKHIFDPFERENTSTISGIEGTGLGMSITKNTVDLMGGRIRIESKPAKGSTFFVEFDFKRQDVARKKEQIRELQGLRALVVDDDFNICDSVTKMLSQIGMRSEWTTSGREAVFRAQKAHNDGDSFHSYIIDWLMPQMDGIETVRRIRKVIGNEAPIIILTAYDWTEIEDEALAAGVTAFCNKPLFMSDLRNILIETNHSCHKKTASKEEMKKKFYNNRVLVVDDNELNREIVTEILENNGFQIEAAADGSIAVEMIKNSEENYFDLVLMDIQMPIMDGYEASRAIRYLPRQDVADLPIIAMTANAFDEDKEKALENGMNAHITKPLDIKVLLETLEKILRMRQHL